MSLRIVMVLLAFLAGIATSSLLLGAATDWETPVYNDGFEIPLNTNNPSPIIEMPRDRISEDQIIVLRDQVILDIDNAEWSTFTPTKSMMPFLDTGANAIQVKPQPKCTDIKIGDIVSYESKYAEGIIIHRVIEMGQDKEGTFFIVKGDSNPTEDPGKIRCEQIKRVLVAIIY